MESHRKVRKIVPINRFDIASYESWLSHMAAKGLLLEDFGIFFAHFKKEEPQELVYKLEPVVGSEDMPDEVIHKAYLQAGWEYVSCIRDSFAIYKISVEKAEEIHTDPVRQSDAFIPLEKKLKSNVILVAVMGVLVTAVLMSSYLLDDEPILYMVRYNIVIGQFIYILLQLFIIIRGILDIRRIRIYRKQLALGRGQYHEKDYSRSKRQLWAEYGFILAVFIIWIGMQFYDNSQSWRKPIEEITALPTISLEKIEENENFNYLNNRSETGRYYDNVVEHRWSPLAPVQYEIDQSGIIEGFSWADGSGNYEPSLSTSYYEVAFKWLAEPLFNDLIKRYAYGYEILTLEKPRPEVLSEYGIEQMAIGGRDEIQYLFAYKGRKVILITYHGQKDLIFQLGAVAEILN